MVDESICGRLVCTLYLHYLSKFLHFQSPWGVAGGAIAGHFFATSIAVLGGAFLANYISEKLVRPRALTMANVVRFSKMCHEF